MIVTLQNKVPEIHANAWIAPSADIIGQVFIDSLSSVWFGAVLRGDIEKITIGKRSNIQDNSTVHVDNGMIGGKIAQVIIGDDVSIGHNCIVHGCTISDRVLVGMGSIILNNVVIGEDCIIGAGSLLTQNKIFPPRSLIMGSPAQVIRELNDLEVLTIIKNASLYWQSLMLYEE